MTQIELRIKALELAQGDSSRMFDGTTDSVVARAEVYFRFLTQSQNPQNSAPLKPGFDVAGFVEEASSALTIGNDGPTMMNWKGTCSQ